MLNPETSLSPDDVHLDPRVGPVALTFDDFMVVPRY
jgi:hypothetical protein